MTRTTAKYISLLALAIVIFHWKTLLTDQFTSITGYENVNQTYAWLHFWLRSIWSGHLPLWDPYAFAGRPFTEEMAGFYPFHLLFALIPLNRNDLISPRFFHEYLALTRFMGACFMFALMREFRRSHLASFIAACAFTMGGLLGRLPWPQYIEACIWLPAVFLFMLRALRAERPVRAWFEAGISGLCLGISVLSGGVQFAMIQGICVAAAIGYFGAVAPGFGFATVNEPRRHWFHMAAILGIIAAVAFGVGAAQLLPSFEYGHFSLRSISGGWFPTSEKIPFDRLVKGMWPQSIATGLFPVGGGTGGEEPWPYYIGVLPMFLAVTAIWKCWKNLWVRFFAVLSAIVFAYSLGEFSPLFGALYAIIPYLWLARGASRFVYLISFSLAALSAFGLDMLLEHAGQTEAWRHSRPFLKWISIAAAAAMILPGIFPQLTLGIWTGISLLLILASCGWFFRLTSRPIAPSVRFMLAAFILLDLGSFNWLAADKNEMMKTGDDYVRVVTMRNAAEFIRNQPGLHRARVSVEGEPNIGDLYGTASMWGGGAAVLTGFSRISPHEDLLNVQYHIKPVATPDPGAVYQDSKWKVYRDANGFPRAWIVHKTVTAADDDAAFAKLDSPGMDLHATAVIQTPLQHALKATGDAAADQVKFKSYEPDRMTLTATTTGAGLLVLSELDYPGWHATLNGNPVPIVKTDGALRGIEVAAGTSRVELEYSPVTAYAGFGLTVFTSACVLAGWILLRRRAPRVNP